MRLPNSYKKSVNAEAVKPAKKIVKKVTAGAGHTCGECMRGEWAKRELDVNGLPFMAYCHKGKGGYSVRKNSNVTLRGSDACEAFCAGSKPFEL